MLLYADDVVLFAKSPESLQHMLNNVLAYSTAWDLEVNTDKTKTLIFENGWKALYQFYYGEILLEPVDSFKYIGVQFFSNVNWNRTQKHTAIRLLCFAQLY